MFGAFVKFIVSSSNEDPSRPCPPQNAFQIMLASQQRMSSEEHQISLLKRSKKHKSLPFVASIQHVKNTNLMIQCEECGMWRLVYAKKKLSAHWRRELEKMLQTFDFSCGASTSDLDLPDELSHVHFRDLSCEDPVEKLYYSMGYDPICIYCSSEDELETQDNFFPICASCKTSKCPISKQ